MNPISYGTVTTPITPPYKTEPSVAPIHDYYSIASSFQHLIVSRQMDLQNAILEYIKKRFGIRSALTNIAVLLLIMHPGKFWEVLLKYSNNALYYLQMIKRIYKSLRKNKQMPQIIPVTVKMEINYIHDSTINHLYMALDWYLSTNAKVVSDHNHLLGIIKAPIEASTQDNIVAIQKTQPQKTITSILYRGKSISFSKDNSDTTVYTPTGELKKKNYQIMLWSTECQLEDLEMFCIFVANQYARSKIDAVWTQKMFCNSGNNWKQESMGMNKRRIETVIMPNEENTLLLRTITDFVDSEDWYIERGINYKKAFLFYGPPGTGKTSMIKALSYEIKRHIHFLNLSLVESDEQLNKLLSAIDLKTTIIVIEDIDAMSNITHKRHDKPVEDKQADDTPAPADDKHKETGSRLTLSGLLNQLDGLHNTHGMLLVMTSNHPEVLDEALIRDGRVDEKILFPSCTYDQIYMMFQNFYGDEIFTKNELLTVLDLNSSVIIPATVECAMKKHYKNARGALQYLSNKH